MQQYIKNKCNFFLKISKLSASLSDLLIITYDLSQRSFSQIIKSSCKHLKKQIDRFN